MDNRELRSQEIKAAEAEQLLSNPLLREWFDETEKAIINIFLSAPIQDFDKLKVLKEQHEAMKLLRMSLDAYVLRGKNATEILEGIKNGTFDNL